MYIHTVAIFRSSHPLVSCVLHHSTMSSSHRHAKESQKRGTATEHAAISQPNAEDQQAIQAARDDRADDSMENLAFRLGEFLTTVLLDALTVSRKDPGNLISHDDCFHIVVAHVELWCQQPGNRHAYSYQDLLLHKRMWDVMTRNKAGFPKEHEQRFVDWCRRVVASKEHAEADSTATKRADSAFTENAECSASFRALAEDILTNDLTEAQMQNPAYKLRKGKAITTDQRSLINVILRKNLGDSRVAGFLFNHPVPRLLDLPLRFKLTIALLQNMLEEFMTWHASLLRSLLDHKQHPDVIMARKLSDLDQSEWQRQRRLWKKEAKQRMNYGASLAEQRDSHKRKFDDMSATEQQTLHDFDTQKAKKTYEATCAKKTHSSVAKCCEPIFALACIADRLPCHCYRAWRASFGMEACQASLWQVQVTKATVTSS